YAVPHGWYGPFSLQLAMRRVYTYLNSSWAALMPYVLRMYCWKSSSYLDTSLVSPVSLSRYVSPLVMSEYSMLLLSMSCVMRLPISLYFSFAGSFLRLTDLICSRMLCETLCAFASAYPDVKSFHSSSLWCRDLANLSFGLSRSNQNASS